MISQKTVKARANKLRDVLNVMGHQIKHTESLEVISKIEGYADWNTYTADLTKKQLAAEQKKETLYCSFCGNSQQEVRKLIAGPEVQICGYCIDICVEFLLKETRQNLSELKDMPNILSLIRAAKNNEK